MLRRTQVERLMATLTCRETLNFREACAGTRETLGSVLRTMLSWEAANPGLAERTALDEEARDGCTAMRCLLAPARALCDKIASPAPASSMSRKCVARCSYAQADRMLLHMLRVKNLVFTEYALGVLGIMHVGDTLVGSASLRGVSGGERRRVGVAEGLVASTMVLLLDEASTGEWGHARLLH